MPQKKSTSLAYFFVLGVIVGCLSLFRPIFIAFTPILALAFSGRRKIVSALLFGSLGTACVVTPWLIRNVINVPHTHGDADLIATTIVDGSYRGYLYKGNPATFPYPRLVDPNGGKAASDVALAVSKVWRDIEDDPQGMALWYLVEKPIYLLQWSNVDGVNDIFVYPLNSTPFTSRPAFLATREIFYRVHWIIVILAGVGAALAWMPFADFAFSPNRRHVLRIASLLLIFVILAHVPFFTATRYAYPVFPALYILALSGIVIVKTVGFRSSYRKAISDVHDQATQTQASVSGFRNANTKQVRTTGAASEDAG